MAKRWNRLENWLVLIVAGVGLLLLGLSGLWMYVSATADPLHPDIQQIPSVAGTDASQAWAASVQRGREVARVALSEQNLPGLSVAVGVDGELVWAEGFGFANLETREPVTPEHRFRIGTASTVLTSAAVGLLVERGRLDLDQPVQTYVPEFPTRQWPVTLRQVMAHTAGLRNDGGDESPLYSNDCARPVDALPEFGGSELRFEPGTQYRFSRLGWILVSAAVEAAGGERFLTFMRDEVFEPLGMRDTRADAPAKDLTHVATSYFPRFAADPRYGPDVMREINLSCYAGAGAFLSTPADLVRFGHAMSGGRLLQPGTIALLQTSLRLPSGEETGYGLGWDIETATLAGAPARVVGHDGDVLGGMTASLLTFPEHQIVVAATSNTSYADTHTLAIRLAEVFTRQHAASR